MFVLGVEQSSIVSRVSQRGLILFLSCQAHTTIGNRLAVFMNANAIFVDSQISEPRINPPAAIVVVNAVPLYMQSLVRMSAKNASSIVLACVTQSPVRNLGRHPQPTRIQAVNEPHNRLALQIKLLQLQIQRRPQFAEPDIVHLEAV